MAPGVRFKILGPIEVELDGEALNVGGPKLRGLLAYLLLHAGDTLTSDGLIDVLWAEHPPATAKATLQVFVSKLRKFLSSIGTSCTIETRVYIRQLRPELRTPASRPDRWTRPPSHRV